MFTFPVAYITKQKNKLQVQLRDPDFARRSPSGCLVRRHCRTKYPNVSWTHPITHQKFTFGLHIVISFLFNGHVSGEGFDISHLCGNKHCLDIDHLYIELHHDNVQRTKCHLNKVCSKKHGATATPSASQQSDESTDEIQYLGRHCLI